MGRGNATTVARPGGAFDTVYPTSAAPDDSTDGLGNLTNDVAAAVAAHLPLWLRPGTTRVSDRIDVTNGLHMFRGAGRQASIIKSTEGATSNPLRFNEVDDITIREFTAKGTAVARNSGSYGLHIETCTDVLVEDVEIDGGVSSGIHSNKCNRVRVKGCYVHDTYADGIHFTCGTVASGATKYGDFIAEGNHVADTGDDGIAVVSYGVAADSFPQAAIVRRATITGNVVVNSAAAGISNHGGADVTITGNVVDATASHGIRVDGEGTYSVTSPARTVVQGNTVKDAGTLAASGSFHGISVSADPLDTGIQIIGNHIINPRNSAIFVDASRATIFGNRINMGSSSSNALVVGSTTNTSRDVPHDTAIYANVIDSAPASGIVVAAPSDDPARNVVVSGNIINEPNQDENASTDGIFLRYLDNVVIEGNVVRDSGGLLRAAIFVSACNHVDIGPNTLVGNTTITLSGCTDVLMPRIVATANPSDTTTYRAGQEWLATSAGRLYIFDGSAWKYAALT